MVLYPDLNTNWFHVVSCEHVNTTILSDSIPVQENIFIKKSLNAVPSYPGLPVWHVNRVPQTPLVGHKRLHEQKQTEVFSLKAGDTVASGHWNERTG